MIPSACALSALAIPLTSAHATCNCRIIFPDACATLAFQVVETAGAANPYDKAVALREHLQTNYPYDYFPPPQQPGAETCDQFLFVDGRGVCEQYVTSLVVMLRVLGIPARLVASYGSGAYNSITGYYEVRANDAHAWAEVYFS